jgi:RNA polymerase sigma-70 factor (ECF subfamily)
MATKPHDWQQTVRELSPGLLAYFGAILPRPVAAEHVQDTLLRLYSNVSDGRFDPAKGSLRMYAYGIARLVRLEATKRRSLERPWDERATMAVASPCDAHARDRAAALRQAITKLKPEEQEIVLLLLDRDLGLAAIAELVGAPLGTVKSHVHRAKARLRELLGHRTE